MSTTSTAIKGVTLTVGNTAVAQIQKIDGPGIKVGKRDVTTLASAAKEYAPSIGDPQELSGTLIWKTADAGLVAMQTKTATPPATLDSFTITLPDTKTFIFSGFFTSLEPKGGDVEATLMADFSIQVSGAITYPA